MPGRKRGCVKIFIFLCRTLYSILSLKAYDVTIHFTRNLFNISLYRWFGVLLEFLFAFSALRHSTTIAYFATGMLHPFDDYQPGGTVIIN